MATGNIAWARQGWVLSNSVNFAVVEPPARKLVKEKLLSGMAVDIVSRKAGRKVSRRKLKKIAMKVLELVKQDGAELSVSLVANREIQALNARFRKKDAPTDVLSFPVDSGLLPDMRLLGDVVISVEKAREQAVQRRRTVDEEIVKLLVHGILHLAGYDHEKSARDARIMGRLEKKIYRTLCQQGLLQV